MIEQSELDDLRQAIAKDEALLEKMRIRRWLNAGSEYAAAKGRIALATDALTELTEQYQAEQLVVTSRPDREKAAASYIDAAADALGKADARLTKALTTAQKALVEVVEATTARNALVEQTCTALAKQGLETRQDGKQVHETGADRMLDGPRVRVRGQWALTIAPVRLLVWLSERVEDARLPRIYTPYRPGRVAIEARLDGVVSDVPACSAVEAPKPPKMERGRLKEIPVHIHNLADAERSIDREELQGWSEMQKEGESYRMRAVRPTEEMKARAEDRKLQLRENIKSGRVVVG